MGFLFLTLLRVCRTSGIDWTLICRRVTLWVTLDPSTDLAVTNSGQSLQFHLHLCPLRRLLPPLVTLAHVPLIHASCTFISCPGASPCGWGESYCTHRALTGTHPEVRELSALWWAIPHVRGELYNFTFLLTLTQPDCYNNSCSCFLTEDGLWG